MQPIKIAVQCYFFNKKVHIALIRALSPPEEKAWFVDGAELGMIRHDPQHIALPAAEPALYFAAEPVKSGRDFFNGVKGYQFAAHYRAAGIEHPEIYVDGNSLGLMLPMETTALTGTWEPTVTSSLQPASIDSIRT